MSAYLPGVTKLPEQPTEDPDGDTARQRQRYIERQIRHYKAREQTALTEDGRKSAGRKKRAWQGEIRDHLEANPDLKRLRYREQIGAGNIATGQRRDDAAGDIAAQTETSLDGQTTVPAPTPRSDEPAEAEDPAAQVDEQQADLLADAGSVADALAAGRRQPASLTADELRAADQVFTDRAALLGQPGQVGRTHQAVRDELDSRAAPAPAAEPALPDWSTLTDEQLERALDEHSENPAAVEAIVDETTRREDAAAQTPEQPPNWAAMSDAELEQAMSDYADDPDALEAIFAEYTLREEEAAADAAAAPEPEPEPDEPADEENPEQWAEFDRLVAEGLSEEEAWAEVSGTSIEQMQRVELIAQLREDGYRGRGLDELLRDKYRAALELEVIRAENATNGFLFNPQGQRKAINEGLDQEILWTQNEAYARRWASEELRAYWDEHGRLTFEDFKADHLGGNRRERTGGDSFLR